MNERLYAVPKHAFSPAMAADLPVVIAGDGKQALASLDADTRHRALAELKTAGGVLFRGYTVSSPLEFKRFAASFGLPLKSYEFGSTPRSKVFPGVYTSTEYPAHKTIPQHNEQSYTRQWPEHIWFHCILPSSTGGETPISDSRRVFQAISAPTRQIFMEKGLLYVRNYSAGLDVPWQQVFNTDDRDAVSRYCTEHGIECTWLDDDTLQTREFCQAALQHPESGEWVWFNQAHLFHVSAIEPEARQNLLDLVGMQRLPRNVYFGDGSPIPDALLDEIRAAYEACTVAFPWQAGDVLMLDNRLVAHGRNPFTGDRKVIVAMA